MLHICGHIHAGRGSTERHGVLHVNAANCHSHNKLKHPITSIEISNAGIAKIV